MILFTVMIAFLAGAPVVPCDGNPEGGEIILNEFMSHPLASTTETEGEWIELYNRTDGWINLSGWKIVNRSGDTILLNSYLLPPEGYFIAGASGDESRNGGYTPNFIYCGFTISDSDDLRLVSKTGAIVDMISFNGTWDIIPGHSLERINPGWVSNISSSWSHAATPFGNGDFGTPGILNSVFQNSFSQNTWAFIKAFAQ